MIILDKTSKRKPGSDAVLKAESDQCSAASDQETEDVTSREEIITDAYDTESPPDMPQPDDTAQDLLTAERDKYLRLAAEYDNFRKRSAKEQQAAYRDARADTIIRLLPVYDNLERALKMTCTDEAFYKGIELTMTGLTEVFENMGVVPIKALGEPFDPDRHDAVMVIENPELGEKIVAEEFQKGFILGDKVIRFSTVVVAN